jgi:hypothetical protein
MAWQEFNRSIERIVKSNSGPDLTWMWVGLGAAVLLVVAPYLAGAIGGFMGLGVLQPHPLAWLFSAVALLQQAASE